MSQCSATTTPMPANAASVRGGMARSSRHNGGQASSTTTTISMRHHTSSSAGRLISLPRIAVKPHSSTQKWICSSALRSGDMGIGWSDAAP